MATANLMIIRIAAGLAAMLFTVAAGEALSASRQPPGGSHFGRHGGGPSGFCALYPEFRLMRHPHHGGFGYFRVARGQCLWIPGPPERAPSRVASRPTNQQPASQPPASQPPANQGQTTLPNVTAPYCREYQDHILIGKEEVEAYGTACLQPDGAWELQPGTTPTASDQCREFRRIIEVGNDSQQQVGTACLRPGAVWEIVTVH